ncbi:MAG: GerW family sporulation protein [Clostridia bacterium]|nr:GerW family sporulation protein [Clostridia bacterium]
MEKHPIESIMTTTMENLKDMIDVDTVIGQPIAAGNGATVIPISKVSLGFVAGGGEYAVKESGQRGQQQEPTCKLPFAGGTGTGVSVNPVGFLVVNSDCVRLLPAQHYEPTDRIIELVPQVLAEARNALSAFAKEKNGQQQPVQTPQATAPADPVQAMPQTNY